MPDPVERHLRLTAPGERPVVPPLGRNIIVAIGISRYDNLSALPNAVNDARAALSAFQRCGFAELPDAPSLFDGEVTLDSLTSLVRDTLPSILQTDDRLVLFFAGHGETVESRVPDPLNAARTVTRRTGYLIPVDARANRPGDWLRLDSFLEDVANLPARHILVVLDACKSGFALSEKFKVRGGEPTGTVRELNERVSRRVLTSALHDQEAQDGGRRLGNSLFTETLISQIEGLRADEYLTSSALFNQVRQQVSDDAARIFQRRQTPDYGVLPGDGSGELVLWLQGDYENRRRAHEELEIGDLFYDLGVRLGQAERLEGAGRQYRRALAYAAKGHAGLPLAEMGLGKALFATGQTSEATDTLARLIAAHGDQAPTDAWLYLGMAQARAKSYADAAATLEDWLARATDHPDAAWVAEYTRWLRDKPGQAADRRLGLLIGIDTYLASDSYFPMRGCVNDVTRLMQPLLRERFGFQPDDLTVLTNERATRANVLAGFARLKATAQPEDAVIVHFSGHSIPTSRPDYFGPVDHDKLYLILHDTAPVSDDTARGISPRELHDLMQTIPATHKTLILDTHAHFGFIDLARREGNYSVIIATDTAEFAYEWEVKVAGTRIHCGMLSGALFETADKFTTDIPTIQEWVTPTLKMIADETSNPARFQGRQIPLFVGIPDRRLLGGDDDYLAAFELSLRRVWPRLSVDQIARQLAVFRQAISAPHPQLYAALGHALLAKQAYRLAIAAFQHAIGQTDNVTAEALLALGHAQVQAQQASAARDTFTRLADLSPANKETIDKVVASLDKLAMSRKHAVLVGINTYRSDQIKPLEGAINDVHALRDVLVQRYGFNDDHITLLTEEQATRAAILAAFTRLVGLAHNDTTLFFFAGYGSRDADGAPTLVPVDGRQNGVEDISVEELARLAADAPNLWTILDTRFFAWPQGSERRRVLPPAKNQGGPSDRFAKRDEYVTYVRGLRVGVASLFMRPDLTMEG